MASQKQRDYQHFLRPDLQENMQQRIENKLFELDQKKRFIDLQYKMKKTRLTKESEKKN